MSLTEAQLVMLAFIARYTAEHGYPPTLREMATSVGSKSTHTGHSYVRALVAKGVLTKTPTIARSLVLTDEGRRLLERRPSA